MDTDAIVAALQAITARRDTHKKIESILRRWHPYSWAPPPLGSVNAAGQLANLRRIDADRAMLMAKPAAEVDQILTQLELAKRSAEQARLDAEEEARPFNQPDALPDYRYWTAMDRWTPDEAAALILDRSPDAVNSQEMRRLAPVSKFAARYVHVHRLVERSGQLDPLAFNSVRPAKFVAWAHRAGLDVCSDLLQLLATHSGASGQSQPLATTDLESSLLRPTAEPDASPSERPQPSKRVTARQANAEVVLNYLRSAGLDPLALPPPPANRRMKSVKAEARDELTSRHKLSKDQFDHAWKALLKDERIGWAE